MNKKPRNTLNVSLGKLKEPWIKFCEEEGIANPGEPLRKHVNDLLTSQRTLPRFVQVDKKPDERKKIRLQVSLTPSEHTALMEAAESVGVDPYQFLILSVREKLTRQLHFVGEWADVLKESNRELNRIGVNLNQWIKHLSRLDQLSGEINAPEIEKEAPTIDEIVALVRQHTLEINKALHDPYFRLELQKDVS